MVRAAGPRRGQIDEFAATVRRGYVAYNDDWRVTRKPWLQIGHGWPGDAAARAHRAQRQDEMEAAWAMERAQWEAAASFILSTSEMFESLHFINDTRWKRFTFAADREDKRRWLVPGSADGGIVVEVEWVNADGSTPTRRVSARHGDPAFGTLDSTWWPLPGVEGDWFIAGTDQRAPGSA